MEKNKKDSALLADYLKDFQEHVEKIKRKDRKLFNELLRDLLDGGWRKF